MAAMKPMASEVSPKVFSTWGPEAEPVEPGRAAEAYQSERQHPRFGDRMPEVVKTHFARGLGFRRNRCGKRVPLVRGEPFCLLRPVVKKGESDETEQDCRQPLDDEQPLPAHDAPDPPQLEKKAR